MPKSRPDLDLDLKTDQLRLLEYVDGLEGLLGELVESIIEHRKPVTIKDTDAEMAPGGVLLPDHGYMWGCECIHCVRWVRMETALKDAKHGLD